MKGLGAGLHHCRLAFLCVCGSTGRTGLTGRAGRTMAHCFTHGMQCFCIMTLAFATDATTATNATTTTTSTDWLQIQLLRPRSHHSPCLQTHHTHHAHHHYNSLTISECKSKQCVFVRDARVVRDVRAVRDVRVGAILPNKSDAPWCAVVRRHAP